MKKLLLTSILFSLLSSTASASVYVKPTGDDTTCTTDNQALACQTITKAVSIVQDGQSVYCLPGTYLTTVLTKQFTKSTTIRGSGCHIPGLTIRDGKNYNLMGLKIDGAFIVQGTTSVHANSGLTVTNPNDRCVFARGNSDFALVGVVITNCRRGIAAPGSIGDDSYFTTIRGSTLTHFTEDAIAIGDWYDTTIEFNTIQDMSDPAGVLHNDGIQTFGDIHNLNIQNNTIDGSRSQGMLLQQNQPGDHVFVQGNRVTNIRGVAIQADAVPGLVVDGNTLCGGTALQNDALWFWFHNIDPNDVTVTNNHLSKQYSIRSQPVNIVVDFNNVVDTPCGA